MSGCSSRKLYRTYFNKIYSNSSGLNWPYEHVLMSSYEQALICSSHKLHWKSNKIYGRIKPYLLSGTFEPYEQMSMCS